MAYIVTTYAELEQWVRDFADDDGEDAIHVLIIVGNPGLLKSTIVEDMVGEKARWLEGTLSAFELYREAYEHRDKPFVIDDVDELYHDKAAVRLLKCLCQTKPIKRLGWHTATRQLEEKGIPKEFESRSRVCIIANEWRALNKNLGALEDRGVLIQFQPTAAEVHAKAKCADKEVYDFIGMNLSLIVEPSIRQYRQAVTMKKKNHDWKNWLLQTWNTDSKMVAMIEVLNDPNITDKRQMESDWIRRTRSSRPTYFRYLQALPPELKAKAAAIPKVKPQAKVNPKKPKKQS
jgi:hypothetical protein